MVAVAAVAVVGAEHTRGCGVGACVGGCAGSIERERKVQESCTKVTAIVAVPLKVIQVLQVLHFIVVGDF